ncbi:hypothetical protein TNIN_416001 [Trichonephila inaurata madagascariensis]|uniref:Uncharacterized protein n=1 Tax=Trichonephila inaurata madagascariensis TaxID=2747483 RepID=A0A8X7CHL7_9ARAC|nr:hypothetical protein TNIN_416001 [Trichonephila inaurata madagascariensis]
MGRFFLEVSPKIVTHMRSGLAFPCRIQEEAGNLVRCPVKKKTTCNRNPRWLMITDLHSDSLAFQVSGGAICV